MKFGFGRRRRGAVDEPLFTQDGMDASSAMQTEDAVHLQSRQEKPHRNEGYGFDREFDDVEGFRKKGLGGLVRKLNCSASKEEEDTFENMMYSVPSARKRDPSKLPWGWKPEEVATDITRPVVITVKDGDIPCDSSAKQNGRIESKTSFVVGQPASKPKDTSDSKFKPFGRSRSFRNMISRSSSFKRKNNPPRSIIRSASDRKNRGRSQSPGRISSRKSSPGIKMPSSREMKDLMTPQDSARKQRWLRGLERGWGDDFSEFNDESTCTSRSAFTGLDSQSVHTDYTTDVTISDESDAYSPRRTHKGFQSSPPRGGSRRNVGLWQGVAEDMGIIAGMLLSDGSACVGSMAAITKETVTNCKGEDY